MTFANKTFSKDPDEVADFGIDWTDLLAGDTILTSDWTVPTGITNDGSTNTSALARITLSGGTAGVIYYLSNKITTASGYVWERTVAVAVVDK